MLLCIDIGNTNIVLGVTDRDRIVDHWRIRTEKEATADELGILIGNLFRLSNIQMEDISDIIISCVVPPLLNSLEEVSGRYFNVKPRACRYTIQIPKKWVRTGLSMPSRPTKSTIRG